MMDVPDDEGSIYEGPGGSRHAPAGGALKHSHDKEHHHKVQRSLLPGVFWVYEINPFMVNIEEDVNEAGTYIQLFVRLLAIVGGVWTIVGWIDGWMLTAGFR